MLKEASGHLTQRVAAVAQKIYWRSAGAETDWKIRMSKMARFRNLFVHLYGKVDDREVFLVIRENLGDFDLYLRAIGRYLRAEL